nr:MAG TPA: hypothetical protein [Caudoviricetes sp.]
MLSASIMFSYLVSQAIHFLSHDMVSYSLSSLV